MRVKMGVHFYYGVFLGAYFGMGVVEVITVEQVIVEWLQNNSN